MKIKNSSKYILTSVSYDHSKNLMEFKDELE